jgi:hemerythrin-like domain-containing protein
MTMCDYCGCRRSGPTAELAAEHERLLELADVLDNALYQGTDPTVVFAEFLRLLQMHAAKEEVGLFVHAKASTPLGDRVDALCREHDDLHRWLADGPTGAHVPKALLLLATHIDDEEHDLFPHIIHALDPEQWDEIELAHRAVEAVWDEPVEPAPTDPGRHRDDRFSA